MLKDEKDPFLGTRIREYEILEVLGKGGMGAVYKARHVYLEEERAIKVIQSQFTDDQDLINRFIREAKILSQLRHPNLVALYEFGTLQQNVFFMVLEYLKGERVLDLINKYKRIEVNRAIKIIREAADGLRSAHSMGIIHRDVSPDNLFLVKDNSGNEITKIIDFGVAKPWTESTSGKNPGYFLGKAEYCSPEQCGLLPEGETIDARCDIYSLGVTLFKMLTGELPFRAESARDFMIKHAMEAPPPPSSLVTSGEIPRDLDRVILRMLAKNREERYSTMEEVKRELDQAVPSVATTVSGSDHQKHLDVLQSGDLFARRYLIENKLGSGGMAVVYKAIDKILEAPVALKIISREIVDAKILERFKREVILARKVAHPNVCRIFDIGENEGIHYVSMQYLEGATLAQMIPRSGRLEQDTGITIMKQVLMALNEAHRVGVVHRDLKPQNIMVDSTMRTHIMDFGISISSDMSRITQTGVLVGTPFYMAPEQFHGKEADHRTDIYSIGLMMYEMFTGRLPFNVQSSMAVIHFHMNSRVPPPSEIVSGFDTQLELIIMKALEKEPDNRYQNVKDMLQDLDHLRPSTTQQVLYAKEGLTLAHKLLAERKYSEAIRLLSSLVNKSPMNPKLEKLLHIAVSESAKKDLRHARILIQKNNLEEAELLLDKLAQTKPTSSKITSQIQKVRSLLKQKIQSSADIYIGAAEVCLQNGDCAGGLNHLDSASNFSPEDPRIEPLRNKFLEFKDLILISNVEQAKELAAHGKEHESLIFLSGVLKERPDFEPAVALQTQILENLKDRFREAVEKGQSKFDAQQWDEAIDFWESALKIFPDEEPIKEKISQADTLKQKEVDLRNSIYSQLIECEALTAEDKIDEAAEYFYNMQKNLSPDEISLFQEQFQKFNQKLAQLRLEKELESVTLLYNSGEFKRALDQLSEILTKNPNFEQGFQLRKQIEQDRSAFNNLISQADENYRTFNFEDAIRGYKDALKIRRADPYLKKQVEILEEQITREGKIRKRIKEALERARQLATGKNFEEAEEELQSLTSLISDNQRLQDLSDQIQIHLDQLQQQIESEKALSTTQTVRPSIENHELFRHGIQFFQSFRWEEAASCFEALVREYPDKADSIHPYVVTTREKARHYAEIKDWLKQASEQLEFYLANQEWEAATKYAEDVLKRDYSSFTLNDELSVIQKHYNFAWPTWREQLLSQAAQLINARNYEEAHHLYIEVLKKDFDDPDARAGIHEIEEAVRKIEHPTMVLQGPPPLPADAASSYSSNRFKYWFIYVGAVAAVLFISLGAWFWAPLKKPSATKQLTLVSINALPWANVHITPVNKEVSPPNISDEESITPCYFMLPAGEYLIMLENGGISPPLKRSIQVSLGKGNSFEFLLPGYNPENTLQEIGEKK